MENREEAWVHLKSGCISASGSRMRRFTEFTEIHSEMYPCIWHHHHHHHPFPLPCPPPLANQQPPTHPPPVHSPWGRILVLTSADWILTSQSMFPLGGDTGAAKGKSRREDMQERPRPPGDWTKDLPAVRLEGAKRCANRWATEVTKVVGFFPP